jgi:hypothetical protein
VTGGAWADGHGARAVLLLLGARVDGGLPGPACASRELRVRRWVRIWSITDVWVMKATMHIAPWQDGHASGSTSKICCRSAAHRRVASVGASLGAGSMAGGLGPSEAASASLSRAPRGRLAYQPSYRVVTWPLSGMCTSTRARNSSESAVSVSAVGPSDLSDRYVTALRDGIPRAVPGEPRRERAIVLGDPHGGVHVKSGVRPGEHARGLVLVEEFETDEEPEHGAAERFRQPGGVGGGPRDKRSIEPEAAVGDEQVQMRMPVRAGAMCLQTGDDADREVALAGQRANGGHDGAGTDTADLAEQATPVQRVGAKPLGDGEHDLPVRHRREQCRVQPLRPDRQPLGVTAGAEVPALAREREQIFVRTVVTANTREPVVEDAAGEELLGDLRDDGAPRAVLAREELVVYRL